MTMDREATIMSNPRPAANLIVKQGPQIGILFPVTGNRVVLGREETCDIIIQDAEVSRRHSELVWEHNGFLMQDLGSSNGTFVNGVQITSPTRLKPGDVIGLGQTGLVLEMETATTTAGMDYEAPHIAPRPVSAKKTYPEQKPSGSKKWLVLGCGFLMLLCVCGAMTLLGLDMVDVIDLGISGFSEWNLDY